MGKPRVCVLRTAGTNCDKETAFAFAKAGAEAEFVHINRLVSGEEKLGDYHILALSGGFSYGDDIAAGKILANELKTKLSGDLKEFIRAGKLIIGICNGFQIMVKAGLLPGNKEMKQEVSLINNDSAKFEARWVYLKPSGKCIWTKNITGLIYLPVAHGEGKFIAKDNATLERLKESGQIVFQYCDESGKLAGYPANPNGSAENIAGICDETGRVFGLMPHPERHVNSRQHPRWSTSKIKNEEGDGFQIFKNGVEYVKKNI